MTDPSDTEQMAHRRRHTTIRTEIAVEEAESAEAEPAESDQRLGRADALAHRSSARGPEHRIVLEAVTGRF